MKLPQFIPVLTAFAARVSGRNLDQLLQSPAELARALAETQAVVGHDGVLCIYEGSLLASSCIGKPNADASAATSVGQNSDVIAAKPPADALRSQPFATVLDAIPALRHRLSGRARVFTTFAGPGLLHAQLHDVFESCGSAAWDGSDYVADVILAAVRNSLEMKADGIALIERSIPAAPAELLRVYKKVRKLADFYDAGFLLFVEQGREEGNPKLPAHCIFELGSVEPGMGPVTGRLGPSGEETGTPFTTAGDIPAGTSVSDLKSLLHRRRDG